ncbi:MAG: type II toxin-antitoxin system RelE/ParE family toxin [Planctomycetes bacterium]|nr:type II toxin-antitoxin system RelE/ParE family toxin [Planctomycetota bacterium]
MPPVRIVFFKDASGRIPVLEWLRTHRFRDPLRYDRVTSLVRRLEEFGHELRRPVSGHLGGGIHELRAHAGRVQIRVLYFFHGTTTVALAVVCRKEARVEHSDLWDAVRARNQFEALPGRHWHEEEDY